MDIKISDAIKTYDIYSKNLKESSTEHYMGSNPLKKEEHMLDLSPIAKEYNLARQAISKHVDYERENRINKIKMQIENNQYSISPKDMVEKLMERYR